MSMVTISLISCLLTLRRLGSVGVGTIIAAVLVGTVLGFVTRLFGVKRDAILYPTAGRYIAQLAKDKKLRNISIPRNPKIGRAHV